MAFEEARNGFLPNYVVVVRSPDPARPAPPQLDVSPLDVEQQLPESDQIVVTSGLISDPLEDFTVKTGAQFG